MKIINIEVKIGLGNMETDVKSAVEKIGAMIEATCKADEHGICWTTPDRSGEIVHMVRFRNGCAVGCSAMSPSRLKDEFERWFGVVCRDMVTASVEYDGPNDVGHKTMLVELATVIDGCGMSVRVFGASKDDPRFGVSFVGDVDALGSLKS